MDSRQRDAYLRMEESDLDRTEARLEELDDQVLLDYSEKVREYALEETVRDQAARLLKEMNSRQKNQFVLRINPGEIREEADEIIGKISEEYGRIIDELERRGFDTDDKDEYFTDAGTEAGKVVGSFQHDEKALKVFAETGY